MKEQGNDKPEKERENGVSDGKFFFCFTTFSEYYVNLGGIEKTGKRV